MPDCYARWNTLGRVTPQNFPTGRGTACLNYTGDIQSTVNVNTEDCEYAVGRMRDVCHGKNGQTRVG